MNATWGVYDVCGRLPGGKETTAGDRNATTYFVRWRVDGMKRRRSFETKGAAKQWRETLIAAKNLGWQADERGWPLNPVASSAPSVASSYPQNGQGWTIETYVDQVWWPNISSSLNDKSRIRHRHNADTAIRLLRLREGDPRTRDGALVAGHSIPVELWTPDDTKAALVARRSINGRTAAKNQRLIEASLGDATLMAADVVLEPELAGQATVRDFWITLGMIAKAASASKHTAGDPMADTAGHAAKPRPLRRSDRLVPNLDELFDLADAISQIGVRMPDGRPRGARFRSLILCAGTTGPRPGELRAHRPQWFDGGDDLRAIRFHRTEAAVYGVVLDQHEKGLRERALKHQPEDEFRTVPLTADVRAALVEHVEHGYSSLSRTWLSPTGRGHLDFGNLTEDYWQPALRQVFAGTAKDSLIHASPKVLRKAAITYWLDSGINEGQAAEWAGHSEEVSRIYYASRSSTDFAKEVGLLEKQAWARSETTPAANYL